MNHLSLKIGYARQSHQLCRYDTRPHQLGRQVSELGAAFSCMKWSPDKEPNKTRFGSYTTSPPPHTSWMRVSEIWYPGVCLGHKDLSHVPYKLTNQHSSAICVLVCATVCLVGLSIYMEDTVLQEISMVTNLISVTTFSLYFTAALALSS